MDMHIYRKFLNACQLSGTKKSERIKYPFWKIDVYAVKIYRNDAYGNGTGNMSAGRAGLQDMGSRWKCAKSEAGREPGETYLLPEILNSQGGIYCQEGE